MLCCLIFKDYKNCNVDKKSKHMIKISHIFMFTKVCLHDMSHRFVTLIKVHINN